MIDFHFLSDKSYSFCLSRLFGWNDERSSACIQFRWLRCFCFGLNCDYALRIIKKNERTKINSKNKLKINHFVKLNSMSKLIYEHVQQKLFLF